MRKFEYAYIVIPGIVRNVNLGFDWMREYKVRIDSDKGQMRG